MSDNWFANLKEDFKRVYIEQWGEKAWNEAVINGSLPKWLEFSRSDLVDVCVAPSLGVKT